MLTTNEFTSKHHGQMKLPPSCLFLIYLFAFYLKNRETDLPPTGSLPKSPQQPDLGQVEARNLELNPGFLAGWQGHLLPPREQVSRKLALEAKLGLQLRLLGMGSLAMSSRLCQVSVPVSNLLVPHSGI